MDEEALLKKLYVKETSKKVNVSSELNQNTVQYIFFGKTFIQWVSNW